MTTNASRACGAACVVALATAGCGGGGGGSTISKQDYVKRVTARCRAYQHERRSLDAALSKLGDPSKLSSAQVQAVAGEIVKLDDTTRRVVRDIRALPKPDEGKARLERSLAATDPGVAALDEADKAARAGDGKALTAAFVKVGVAFATANQTGREFGLNACG